MHKRTDADAQLSEALRTIDRLRARAERAEATLAQLMSAWDDATRSGSDEEWVDRMREAFDRAKGGE